MSLERETAGTDWKSMAEQALSLLSNAFNLLDASTTERVSPMERGCLAGLNFHSVMCVEPGFFFWACGGTYFPVRGWLHGDGYLEYWELLTLFEGNTAVLSHRIIRSTM